MIVEEVSSIFEDKLLNMIKEEVSEINLDELEFDLLEHIAKLELKSLALESGTSNRGGIFTSTALVDPLIPAVVRADMASIEFKIALL